MQTRGDIPKIIGNDDKLYDGDLIHYFRMVFNHARNLRYPYHNFRHMMHVLWLCHNACIYYKALLTPREMRNLLIAALFHDFDHSGLMGDDDINIMRALRALEKHLLPEDRPYLEDISMLIKATEYPYKVSTGTLGLMAQIIRDADVSQALSVAWVQQVIFGLAGEWGKKPIEILKMQGPFMTGLKFWTKWGQEMFPQNVIDDKITEAWAFLEILGEQTPPPAKPA